MSSKASKSAKRKRTVPEDLVPHPPSPDEAEVDTVDDGKLEFGELLDEDALMLKSTQVNRAPVMMAWATVVAERLGFKRAEALSIGEQPNLFIRLNELSMSSVGIH